MTTNFKMSKVLITGATGLLGANTIQELLNCGYLVKALVRDKSKFIFPNGNNIELAEGNLADSLFIENSVKDCDLIINAAAETNQGLIHYSDYHTINVEFCKLLYTAAVNNGVKRIIHVSTSNVFGYGDLLNPGEENTRIKAPFSNSLYVKSKIASQNIALSFSEKTDVIIVNPTFLIGSFDQKPSSGRIILYGYNKKIIFFPPGGKNFVDVKDVSRAIVALLTKGINKESYILSGENLTYKEFFTKLNSHSNKRSIYIGIPRPLLFLVGMVGDMLRIFGIKNEYTLTNMKILCVKNYYSNTKAKKELNMEFNYIDSAITDAIDWFKLKGMLND